MTELLYEPRALWSIANVTLVGGTAFETRVMLDRQHFTNRTRWPMTLKRMVLSAINYTFDQNLITANALSQQPNFWLQSADVIQQVQVRFSAPQRYDMNAKSPVNSATLTPRPRWEPPQPTFVMGAEFASLFSSYIGTSQLIFDQPLYIPRTAALDWQMSCFSPVVFHAGAEAPITDSDVELVMLYQEAGGMFFGNGRVHSYRARPYGGQSGPLNPFGDFPDKWPFPPDLASADATYTALPGTQNWWDPLADFTAKKFKDQEVTRQGSTCITDMRAMINQTGHDAQVAIAFQNAFGYVPAQKVAPLATRMGTRVKTVGCGSESWWWRPGAPLALVFDAMSPGLVYDLPEEITLMPGDTLNVEMVFPPNVVEFTGNDATIQPTVPVHVGVSFNGYAPIEG